MKVVHEFSNRTHFFKVISDSKEEYSISVKVNCTCRFMSVQGVANDKVCSHVLAVFDSVVKKGGINNE